MHIPDAFLSPSTELVGYAAMAPVWWIAVRQTRKSLTTGQTPLLAVCAAYCFAIQMFNIPALGGTTAHPVGTALVAVLLGPWAAILAMTLTLAVQAALFGDGGLLSLGVNAWSMAVVPAFVGYGVFQSVRFCFGQSERVRAIGAAASAFLATVAASLSTGLVLGLQPLLFHDAAGRALYFPFGWSVTVPAIVNTHLLIAGPVEAVVTAFAFAFLVKNFPELTARRVQTRPQQNRRRALLALACIAALTPVGLIASGSAWGEWDIDSIRQMVGYAPTGIERAPSPLAAPLADYALPGASNPGVQVFGYVVCALVGMASVAFAIRSVIGREPKRLPGPCPVPRREGMPEWMTRSNETRPVTLQKAKPWFERTMKALHSKVERLYIQEGVSSRPGLLQSAPFGAKFVALLGCLIAISTAHYVGVIVAVMALVGLALISSGLQVRKPGIRAAASVAFFGPFVILPVLLSADPHGPAFLKFAGFAVSSGSISSALLIALRLFTGVFTTMAWASSTKWSEVTNGLLRARVPSGIVESLSLTHRYVFVLAETLMEMLSARRSRQAGALRGSDVTAYAGAGSAILLGKSMALVEEVHMAMRARSPGLAKRREGAAKPKSKRWTLATLVGLLLIVIGSVNHVI